MAEEIVTEVEYRDIPGFEGYRVGSDGSVWSCRKANGRIGDQWKRLKPQRLSKLSPYFTVTIGKLGGSNKDRIKRLVHCLVLEVFKGQSPPQTECCHYNGKPADNSLGNLRWGTAVENKQDSRRHETIVMGEKHPKAKLNQDEVRRAREYRKAGMSYGSIGGIFNVDPGTIWQAVNGRSWNHVA